jgi:hypothetical protein
MTLATIPKADTPPTISSRVGRFAEFEGGAITTIEIAAMCESDRPVAFTITV